MPVCFGASRIEQLTEDDDAADHSQTNKSSTEGGVTTDEELESRMSRRSSVLVDLISLFRRSSSVLLRPHTSTRAAGVDDGEDDEDEEDTRTMSKDRILEAIRHKREIIGKLRSQPWNMKRKRRTLKVAQRHLQRQEAKVSKARLFKAEAGRRITQMSRWFDNIKIYLIPWEAKIKRIESHFGSVVSSYFTFLRWTLGVNVTMTVIMLMFVIIPEWLADSRMTVSSERYNRTKSLKIMPDDVRARADEMSTVWDLGGYMEYSLIFYGYYSRETFFGETIRYRVPVAYFLSNLFVLGYSFFTILRKMASNARTSKLSSGKTEQYVFNWKTFTGWDFTIGNSETAGNVHMANVIKFREAIAEYAVNMKRKYRCLQILLRIFANLLVFIMLGFSVWAILAVSQIRETDTFIKQNAVSITVSFITLIFPNLFELIGKLERYHPRTALRIQLARVLCLYIVNYYTLIVSLMMKLKHLENERKALEESRLAAMQFANGFHPIVRNRTLRELVAPSISAHISQATTPAPPPPWTTVFSDYGPIGVSNPKALVSKDTSLHNATIVVTHAIGPSDTWRSPESHNYTTYTVSHVQPFRLPNYKDMCWETQIGQEITKLVVMDLLMTIAAILVIDFFRGLVCRYCNLWWFWNLEKTFPEYGEFKVAENVLHLVNNQGMIWLGLFFVPMLPMINNIKLILLMYIRAWAVMTCNVPARQIFRASRSSNFYLMLLLLMLFLCTLPVGYVIASRKPSKSCGPFGDQPHFYSVITDVLHENLNASLVDAIKYMTSPGIVIPVLLLLLLIIYFLFALVRGLREANHDLSTQLMHERTEEKKKIFELAGGKKKRSITIARKKPKETKPTFGQWSSDDESHSHPKSIASIPRSVGSGGRGFVPSLGSLSEVDHSDAEEAEHEVKPPIKLTLKQQFLVCIGWADPKKYEKSESNQIHAEEGHADGGEYSEEGEEEDDRRDSERDFLLPEKANRSSRERSINSRKSDGRGTSRDASYRTTSQTSSKRDDIPEIAVELAERKSGSARPPSHIERLHHQETEFMTPAHSITEENEEVFEQVDEQGSSSNSHQSSRDRKEKAIQQTARQLLKPITKSKSRSASGATQPDASPNQDPTRPPSADGSLSDPAPVSDPLWNTGNPHSSYTSAMMSPIMNEMLSTDEGTDDEKARLLPDRLPVTQQLLSRRPFQQRAPRFRISMSPPRKKGDAVRLFSLSTNFSC
ncbi:hypothetical protein Y032_0151g2808 [Ancylostoma ceylanicum]|uniref:TMC domain-containing protein n=1 Tax=Ancylostoma ceylanicum TaxID=53326 RepID=A0A016T003_9BILA|nr:hypothetical protein Y032_0151g2808 [Ancylostoma ceylanicum]